MYGSKNRGSQMPARRLYTIIVGLFLFLLLSSQYLPPAQAAAIREFYNTGDDNYWDIFSSHWEAQTFTVGAAAHTITSVKLKLYRVGSPGTIIVSIKDTNGQGHPTGADLTSGTTNGNTLPTGSPYEWREITFTTEYVPSWNTKYAIVVRGGTPSNNVMWRGDS